ncbi:hypothetical protein GF366_03800, partial [Candidatus Peregrinibacteria bacterium]|nr:hypothetical protein [Candidatus Peregrinibacteria bacterium]
MDSKIIQEKGEVKDVTSTLKETSDAGDLTAGGMVEGMYEEQTVKVEILSGENEGELVTIKNDIYGNPFDIEVKEGDDVFLYKQTSDSGADSYFIRDYW